MEVDEEAGDQNALIKRLIEAVNASTDLPSTVPDNVAQLLTAALSQVIQSQQEHNECNETTSGVTNTSSSVDFQRQYLTPADNVESTVEVSGYSSVDQRPLGVKFPAEVRRKIISMRKEGLKCKDIAKDLGASVSGVQKVWERFLATGTIRDRKPSTYAGRPRKYSITKSTANENFISVASPLCLSADTTYVESVSPQAVLVDTREPMEVPGATVEIVASTSTHAKESTESITPLVKKKPKHPYRQELLARLVEDCPLAIMKNDVTMVTSAHVQNLSQSINKPLYMEYVLGHPFGKAPSPKPFEADLEESKIILTDPMNPLGKEVIAALGYSTKVYFNACCKPSPLFHKEPVCSSYRMLPYSIGPNHIAKNMRQVLQALIDMCSDPVQGLNLIHKGPGPVLQAQTETNEVTMTTFAPPSKLSEYWTQLYAYAKLFQCCENFLSPGPPSSPCLLCHPFESFADSLDIADTSPPLSPQLPPIPATTTTTAVPSTSVLLDTATQLLQLTPTTDTPPVVIETPEQIIVSQNDANTVDEVCITETSEIPVTLHSSVQLDTSTDGIQYVAYSTPTTTTTTVVESTPPPTAAVRRSVRKRHNPNYIVQEKKQ